MQTPRSIPVTAFLLIFGFLMEAVLLCEPGVAAQLEVVGETQDVRSVHLRLEPRVSVYFDYTGEPTLNFLESDQSWRKWFSSVDLLSLPDVRKELECDLQQQSKIDPLLSQYFAGTNKMPTEKLEATEHLLLALKSRERVLAVLSKKQEESLERIDRYLFLKKWGLAEFVKVFCPRLPHGARSQIAKEELAVWNEHYEQALKCWRAALTEIGEQLPETEKADWARLQKSFESPLLVDSMFQLNEESEISSVLSGGEDAYKQANSSIFQIEMDITGTWERKAYGNRLADNLAYQLQVQREQDSRTGSNDLNITADQFLALDQKWREYIEDLNALREKEIEQKRRGMDAKTKEVFAAERQALGENWQASVWKDVLFRSQKEFLTEDAQNRVLRISGPKAFLLRDSIRNADNFQSLKKLVDSRLEEFAAELENIEADNLKSLLELWTKFQWENEFPLGFSLEDRPSFARASLTSMFFNSSRLSKALDK
jgi:hypothetical protein